MCILETHVGYRMRIDWVEARLVRGRRVRRLW